MRSVKKIGSILMAFVIMASVFTQGLLPVCASGYPAITSTLFEDTFDQNLSERWEFTASTYYNADVQNGAMNITPIKTPLAGNIIGTVIEGASDWGAGNTEEWDNYAVSADTAFDYQVTATNQFQGIVGRYSSAGYYEFRLYYNGSAIYADLYYFSTAGNTRLVRYTPAQIAEVTGQGNLVYGAPHKLTMALLDNNITCYINDCVLGEITHDILKKGRPGVKITTTGCVYDNFIVQRTEEKVIDHIEYAGESPLSVHQGFTIEAKDVAVNAVYNDNTKEQIPAEELVLSEIDTNVPGSNQLTVGYLGHTTVIPVEVLQRTVFLQEFAEHVNTLASSALTIADKEVIDNLKKTYNSLSPYEAASLGEVLGKYYALLDAMERLLYPNLAQYETVFRDDFHTTERYRWSHTFESNSGKWSVRNGCLDNDMTSYGARGTGWAVPEGLHAKVVSMQADVMLLSEKMYAGFGINLNEYGYYHVRLANQTPGIYTVQLYKKDRTGHKQLAQVPASDFGITVEKGSWNNLKLIALDGRLYVYLDDVKVIEFDDSESDMIYTQGSAGLRVSQGNCRYDNVVITGTRVDTPYVPPIQQSSYMDDFDDELPGTSPNNWMEAGVNDKWKVTSSASSTVYSATYMDAYTDTYLHVFEKDPDISLRFRIDAHKENGKWGIVMRKMADTVYTRVGYDFLQSKWYVESTQGVDFETQLLYAASTYTLQPDTWYTARVVAQGHDVFLYINDQPVLEITGVIDHVGYGRIGVFSDGTALAIDDMSCIFPNGGQVTNGVMETTVIPDEYSNFLELENTLDGKLLAIYWDTRLLSEDGGLTWTETDEYGGIYGRGYSSILQLEDGTYMQVRYDNMEVQTSTDLKNWTTVGKVMPDADQKNSDGQQLSIFHVNTIMSFVKGGGGTRIVLPVVFRRYRPGTQSVLGHYTRIYYSDDQGVTWTPSQNDTRHIAEYDENGTSSLAEGKVVHCSDGSLRLYISRNDYGCMQYTASYDEGVTWSALTPMPEMPCPKSSVAIVEDPYDKGTHYMVWINLHPSSLGSLQPRYRFSLAKSTDGINWEYLMDIERMGPAATYKTGSLYQILDPSIFITRDYIYITYGKSVQEMGPRESEHNEQRATLTRLTKQATPNSSCNLHSLAVSTSLEGSSLITGFDADTVTYSVYVDHTVREVYVTTKADDVHATVTVSADSTVYNAVYNAVYGTNTFGPISLASDLTTIDVDVTAENRTTVKAYTINVTKNAVVDDDTATGGGGNGGTTANDDKPEIKVTTGEDGSEVIIVDVEALKLNDDTGEAEAEIDEATFDQALNKTKADENGVKEVTVSIKKVEGAKAYKPILPAKALSSGANQKVKIATEFAEVVAPGNMFAAGDVANAKNIELSIGAANKDELDAAAKAFTGDRPVIELKASVDGKAMKWSSVEASVMVSVPYTPTTKELADPEHIVIIYIDGEGNIVEIPTGKYDAATGKVTFSTNHFSKYAVAYVHKTFADIADYTWAKKQIEVMASKGVIKGTSAETFAPEVNITRADFMLLLVRALGFTAKVDANFSDVDANAYYANAVGIAKKLGIAQGMGDNTFAPEASISRQDMMVLVKRAMDAAKKASSMGTAADLNAFSDAHAVASYAVDSIASMVKDGIVQGDGTGIDPLGNATRAEVSVIVYRIYNK